MPAKYTYKYIKEYIESRGYKLVSTVYVNSKTSLEMICPNGHTRFTNFIGFKGKKCLECSSNKKYTYEFVKNYVEKRGFELISKTYDNSEQKLEMRCKNGHICFITFKKFKNENRGCSDCYGNKKFEYKEVKEYIETYNYKLLSTEYSNSTEKLHMLCDKGHHCHIPFKFFKNHNRRCMICCGSQKLTYEYVKEYIENLKYKLLSKKYFRNSKKLKMICEKGHSCSISFNSFSQGYRCMKCSGHEKYEYKYVKEYIESEKYKLSSTEYIRNKDNLDMICDKGHKCSISWK